MRWQQPARIAVVVVGLGTAVAVYTMTKRRPVIVNTPLAVAADPEATLQSGAGEQVRTDGSRVTGKITYEQLRQYEDGRIAYSKGRFELASGAVLSADLVEIKGGPDKSDTNALDMTLTGNAALDNPTDKTTLRGDTATYSGSTGTATIPGLATFSRGSTRGTGNGGTWERDTGTIKLLADAKVEMTSSGPNAGAPIKASAQTMTFVKTGNAMLFEQAARIERESDTLSAERATIYLSDDQQGFKSIELRTGSVVAPASGKTSDMPEMRANDIDLMFYDGSQALQRASLHQNASVVMADAAGRRTIAGSDVSFATAPDGKTMTRLDASGAVTVTTPASKDAPARVITSKTMFAMGNDQAGLTAAVFDGDARFEETVPGSSSQKPEKRVGTAQSLRMALSGQLDAVSDATFDKNTKFTSGTISGESDLGVYSAKDGKLELYPAQRGPQKLPHVSDGDVTVDAAELIRVFLASSDLYARKEVKTVTKGDASSKASTSSALFDPTQQIYGFGSEFTYTADTGKGVYVGASGAPARLTQDGGNQVIADWIEFVRGKQDLNARGHVDSTFKMAARSTAGGATGAKPGAGRGSATQETTRRVTADTLTYTEAARTATYVGAPATLKSDDGETSAKTLVITLSRESRTLDRLQADGDVYSTFSTDREATGTTLLYEADVDTYTLQGGPLTLWTRESDGTCSKQQGNFVKFAGATGAPDFPRTRNPGGAPLSSKQVCTPTLAARK